MLRLLLFPFSVMYDIVTSLRNELYDRGYKPSASFEMPVIGIGNLTVGGTGKTPMTEYLVRLLDPPFHVATLSRGYGRRSRGFRIAGKNDNAATIGDEPFQLYRKFGQRVPVAVGEDRALAIPLLLQATPATEVVLLDDAFQHRRVRPSLQVLLTDYNRPFYDDMLLPAGRLRESARGASRADIVVVTKCPSDMKEDEMMVIEENIRDYTDKPVFFSTISYGTPIGFMTAEKPIGESVILVTGIADARSIEAFVASHYKLVSHLKYADHHAYSANDMRKIASLAAKTGASVLTTEKDAVRMDSSVLAQHAGATGYFYIPVQTEFIKSGKDFDEMILSAVRTARRASGQASEAETAW